MVNHEPGQSALRRKLTITRQFFSSLKLRELMLTGIAIYAGGTLLSIVAAHIIFVGWPQSGWGERIISPVTKGLVFLDAHWKSALMLVAPFVVPVARELIPRLRKVGSVEFSEVKVEPVEVREKPTPPPSGEVK